MESNTPVTNVGAGQGTKTDIVQPAAPSSQPRDTSSGGTTALMEVGTEPFSPLRTSGKGSFGRMDGLLVAASIVSGLVMLVLVIMQGLEGARAGKDYTKILNLLMVGAGAFGLGTFAGFIFGAVGEEKQSFAGLATVLNGVIGGFALSDLTKNESLIKSALRSLALSCGLEGVGLVSCVLAFFGSVGFMFMYMNKQYLLNPALSKKQQMAEQNQRLTLLTRSVKVSLAEIGSQPTTEPKILDSIKTSVKEFETAAQKDPDLVELLSVETLKSYSKAYYVTGELGKAESMLRRARTLSPDDPDTLFYLSHVLLTAKEREREAIPYLTFLQSMPNAPVLTWKLLGYACLFDSSRLDEAERASQKYLCFCPNDAGARLNLACVYGQRGMSNPVNVGAALSTLREAIQLDATVRAFVKEKLTEPGKDFAGWKANGEFQNL